MQIINQFKKLIAQASAARRLAYAPYSKFRVGAAVQTASAEIFCAGNIENVSYGLTLCAERVAMANAIAAGQRRFKAIAIAGGKHSMPYPCGACLQVLAEFCARSCPIILVRAGRPDDTAIYQLKDLLPHAFKLPKP